MRNLRSQCSPPSSALAGKGTGIGRGGAAPRLLFGLGITAPAAHPLSTRLEHDQDRAELYESATERVEGLRAVITT